MELNQIKQDLKLQVAQNEVNNVIQKLEDLLNPTSENYNTVILIDRLFHDVEHQHNLNIVSDEKRNFELCKISDSIIHIIDELEDDDLLKSVELEELHGQLVEELKNKNKHLRTEIKGLKEKHGIFDNISNWNSASREQSSIFNIFQIDFYPSFETVFKGLLRLTTVIFITALIFHQPNEELGVEFLEEFILVLLILTTILNVRLSKLKNLNILSYQNALRDTFKVSCIFGWVIGIVFVLGSIYLDRFQPSLELLDFDISKVNFWLRTILAIPISMVAANILGVIIVSISILFHLNTGSVSESEEEGEG